MPPISRCRAVIAALLLVPCACALAQSGGQPAIAGAVSANGGLDPMEAAKYLGTEYKMEADGFRLTPPSGSRMGTRGGTDLASFVVDAKSWGGSLQRIVLEKPMSLDDFIAVTKADIMRPAGATDNPNQPVNIFKGVQILEDKRLKQGEYDAARFTFSAQIDLGPMLSDGVAQKMGLQVPGRASGASNTVQTVSLLRQELIVRMSNSVYMVLMLYTPLADRDAATRTWEFMLPEFELFDKVALVKRRVAAAEAGRQWLAQRSAEELRGKLITDAQFFRMTAGGNDVGYFHFNEFAQQSGPGGSLVDVTRDGHSGVLVTVNMISFADDGTVNMGQNEAFWSYSKDGRGEAIPAYSSWQNTSEVRTKVITATPGRPNVPTVQQLTPWLQESGILSQIGLPGPGPKVPFQINVILAGDHGQHVSNGVNAIIPLEAAPPLPKILEYTWTRFVDLKKPTEMTFSAFDSNSRKMRDRNLIVTGKRQNVNIGGKIESCYKCIDEVDPSSTTLWVDASGKICSMVTSDQSVMIPTTEAAMKARWAKQLAELPRQ